MSYNCLYQQTRDVLGYFPCVVCRVIYQHSVPCTFSPPPVQHTRPSRYTSSILIFVLSSSMFFGYFSFYSQYIGVQYRCIGTKKVQCWFISKYLLYTLLYIIRSSLLSELRIRIWYRVFYNQVKCIYQKYSSDLWLFEFERFIIFMFLYKYIW